MPTTCLYYCKTIPVFTLLHTLLTLTDVLRTAQIAKSLFSCSRVFSVSFKVIQLFQLVVNYCKFYRKQYPLPIDWLVEASSGYGCVIYMQSCFKVLKMTGLLIEISLPDLYGDLCSCAMCLFVKQITNNIIMSFKVNNLHVPLAPQSKEISDSCNRD